MTSEYDADTTVTRADDGRFDATVTDRWTGIGGAVNGGYATALCLAALRQVLPHPDPAVVSSFFLRPCAVGAAVVAVEVHRTGRRTSTATARLRQGGADAVLVTATFRDLTEGEGPTLVTAAAPDLPPPEHCRELYRDRSGPEVSIAGRTEVRAARRPGWVDGRPGGDPMADFWIRFADGRDADAAALALLVDAAPPAVLDLAGVVTSATLQLTTHIRGRPAPGWLAGRVATRVVVAGYHEEDVELWDARGRLVAQARQLALVR